MTPGAGNIRRGAFILFEGVDRCGKSTQCKMLVQNLQSRGIEAELWRYPDRTTAIGQMIDKYLQSQTEMDDAAIHLLFSANRWEKRYARYAHHKPKRSSGGDHHSRALRPPIHLFFFTRAPALAPADASFRFSFLACLAAGN